MPIEILTGTCLPPQCDLFLGDVEGLVDEPKSYHSLFEPVFHRLEQVSRAEVYLQGLLGNLPRKPVEPIALSLGVNVRGLQHLIGQSQWRTASLVDTPPTSGR